MIRAKCHSDDHVIEATFDATPWFEQASADAIEMLRECGFGGDYQADEVVRYMADYDEGARRLFAYLDLVSYKDDAPGFECYINEEDAEAWLQRRQYEVL